MTNWEKKNLLALTLFSFFLIFHILSIVIHVFFTQTLRSPKQKNCFFYFNWVAFCVGIINTLLGYHPFRTINHIASSLHLVYRSIQYETITFLNPNFLHMLSSNTLMFLLHPMLQFQSRSFNMGGPLYLLYTRGSLCGNRDDKGRNASVCHYEEQSHHGHCRQNEKKIFIC